MANRKIVCDKMEIILVDQRKNDQAHTLTYDQIMRIQITTCNGLSWFRKIPSEKIEVYARKFAEPFVFLKSKNKQFYEEYKIGLEKFAKDNRIPFKDLTDSQEKENDYHSQAI